MYLSLFKIGMETGGCEWREIEVAPDFSDTHFRMPPRVFIPDGDPGRRQTQGVDLLRLHGRSRTNREVHVRFRERAGCDSPAPLDYLHAYCHGGGATTPADRL